MSQQKTRLLIADDEEMNKAILIRRLRREGFDTIDAANGADAVRLVRELEHDQRPHVVLMDINMPVMDGIEATRILKAENHGLPVIAVTAGFVNQEEFSDLGFDELCTKPIDFSELIKKIRLTCKVS